MCRTLTRVRFSPVQHPAGPPQLHPEVQQRAAEHVEEPRDLLASLHVARLQPGQRGGGAAHPPRQLRDHQHAAHADADVSCNSDVCLF